MSGKKRFKMFTFSNSVDVINSKCTTRSPVSSGNYMYQEIKILIYLTKILGVKPIYRDEFGKFNFTFTSGIAIYSIFLFVIISTGAIYVMNVFLWLLTDFDMNFDDTVTIYASLVYMGFHMLPFFSFFEGDKIAKYHTSWRNFEVSYYHATRKPLRCEMKNVQYIFLFVLSFFSVFLLYFFQITISGLNKTYDLKITIWDYMLICFIFNYYLWVMLSLEANWLFLTLAIRKAGGILLTDLQDKRLRHHFFEDTYKLWLELNKLTKALGNAFSWTSLYFLAYMFLMIMGTSYLLITSLTTSGTNAKVTYSIASLTCFLMFGLIADCGYRTTVTIGDEFENILLTLLSDERDPVMKRDLRWFYEMISLNPPVISFSGYVHLKRSFNVSMLGNVVTYMVVVLQFRSSIYQKPLENDYMMSSATPS